MATETKSEFTSTEGMTDACRQALRHLLLACADTKLLLGYHYGEWTFGTPALEAAIANCSLSQTELGHVRLLHGVLRNHFDDDSDRLIEQREGGEFANIRYLDRPITDWPRFVAANYVVDLAVTRTLHALQGSSFTPLRMSVDKMLDEERYHVHHGQGWFRTVAAKGGDARKGLERAVSEALESVVEWFGPSDDAGDRALVEAGCKSAANAAVLDGLLSDVGTAADQAGIALTVERDRPFDDWNAATRRLAAGGPDEEILRRLRGSRNEIFKLR